MPETPTPPRAFPADAFAPEYYADQLQIGMSPWGFIFQFGLLSEGGPRPVATVRMSPQHAKVMGLILKRVLAEWEERMGVIESGRSMAIKRTPLTLAASSPRRPSTRAPGQPWK
jgi:hypothetical protein